jgi:hypothetical protein
MAVFSSTQNRAVYCGLQLEADDIRSSSLELGVISGSTRRLLEAERVRQFGRNLRVCETRTRGVVRSIRISSSIVSPIRCRSIRLPSILRCGPRVGPRLCYERPIHGSSRLLTKLDSKASNSCRFQKMPTKMRYPSAKLRMEASTQLRPLRLNGDFHFYHRALPGKLFCCVPLRRSAPQGVHCATLVGPSCKPVLTPRVGIREQS